MNIFVSYARDDQEAVRRVVEGLRLLGRDAWFDEALVGGQDWWDGILERIRNCDAFVQAISRAALESEACGKELNYATALGKPVLPVLVQSVPASILPPDLAARQFVDYVDPTSEHAFRLAAALEQCPPALPLPEPLPDPPETPLSYLGELGQELREHDLPLDRQLALAARLRGALGEPEHREGALELLHRMRRRADLYHSAAQEIEAALQLAQADEQSPTTRADPAPSTTNRARPPEVGRSGYAPPRLRPPVYRPPR